MKQTAIDARSQQMLELLAQGASSRVVAKKLGYSEGTTRVYLHKLYKTIGVRNKTEAVIWQLNRVRAQEEPPAAAAPPPPAMVARAGQSFGEMALAEDLYTALGVMSSFLGPYGHVWEAGMRLKGDTPDAKLAARRAQSRLLWRALLKGDFAHAKKLADDGAGERLLIEAPSDAVLLASVLAIGGYSGAAERLAAQFIARRKGPGISPRETVVAARLARGARARLGGRHRRAARFGRGGHPRPDRAPDCHGRACSTRIGRAVMRSARAMPRTLSGWTPKRPASSSRRWAYARSPARARCRGPRARRRANPLQRARR